VSPTVIRYTFIHRFADCIWTLGCAQGGRAQHDFSLAWLEAACYCGESGQARLETSRFKKGFVKCVLLFYHSVGRGGGGNSIWHCVNQWDAPEGHPGQCCVHLYAFISYRRLSPQFQFLSAVTLDIYIGGCACAPVKSQGCALLLISKPGEPEPGMKVPESCSHIPGAGEGSHKVSLLMKLKSQQRKCLFYM
jgi:hypothetical protein